MPPPLSIAAISSPSRISRTTRTHTHTHTHAGGAFQEVANYFNGGNDLADFSLTSVGNGATRYFNAFSQAGTDIAVSRTFSGDHFAHTAEPSRQLGIAVAKAVIQQFDATYTEGAAQQGGGGRRRRKKGKRALLRTAA